MGGTLESKMPLRSGTSEAGINHGKIETAKSKDSSNSEIRPDGLVGGAGKKDIFGHEIGKSIVGPKKATAHESSDDSIFEGKPEVSRLKLEHEMKMDPKIWRASKAVGLNLSPVERSKLVKEVFSSALGRNISKNDLKISVKKLSKKMLDTKDATAHTKIRKEIKFFKKIGGIK